MINSEPPDTYTHLDEIYVIEACAVVVISPECNFPAEQTFFK